MDGDLKDILIEYKECTIQIIKTIENDDMDCLEELIEKRQHLISEVSGVAYKKEESKNVYRVSARGTSS